MEKLFIAIPNATSMFQAAFEESLDRLDMGGMMVSKNRLCGSLISDARHKLMAKAIESKSDYILWLDSDMVFPTETLIRLMKDIEGHDIVSGLYFMRLPPFAPTIFKNGTEKYLDYPKDQLTEITACGFGCVLMRTSVCEKLVEEYGRPFDQVPGYGEDISFCMRALDAGYHIYCDTGIKLGHLSIQQVTEETWLMMSRRMEDGKHHDISQDGTAEDV